VEARSGRHPGQGRQAPEDRLQTSDQRAPAEDAGDRQAGGAKAGIEVEIKTVVASVFFGSDAANWDHVPALQS
jgi:hypothetical protein